MPGAPYPTGLLQTSLLHLKSAWNTLLIEAVKVTALVDFVRVLLCWRSSMHGIQNDALLGASLYVTVDEG